MRFVYRLLCYACQILKRRKLKVWFEYLKFELYIVHAAKSNKY